MPWTRCRELTLSRIWNLPGGGALIRGKRMQNFWQADLQVRILFTRLTATLLLSPHACSH